jgi:hypothetical protein
MPSRAGITTGHPLTTWELLTETDQKTAGHELDELMLPQQRFPGHGTNFGVWGTAPKKVSVNSWPAERRGATAAMRTYQAGSGHVLGTGYLRVSA